MWEEGVRKETDASSPPTSCASLLRPGSDAPLPASPFGPRLFVANASLPPLLFLGSSPFDTHPLHPPRSSENVRTGEQACVRLDSICDKIAARTGKNCSGQVWDREARQENLGGHSSPITVQEKRTPVRRGLAVSTRTKLSLGADRGGETKVPSDPRR